MTWWQSLILGLVQGLTEFLPISSSGHLALFNALFETTGTAPDGNQLFFFTMLHAATAVAVIVGMWQPIIGLFRRGQRMNILKLAVATLPAGLVGVLCSSAVEGLFSSWHWLWIFFLATAVLLLTTELLIKRRNRQIVRCCPRPLHESLSWRQTLFMGCAQGLAVFPGFSRSGVTVSAGLIGKGEAKRVADFSFLMSIPIILAGALFSGLQASKAGTIGNLNPFYIAIGMCAAFISGLFAVRFMLKVIARADYKWFALYLVILSVVLCGMQFGI